jgi:hypothetical protein
MALEDIKGLEGQRAIERTEGNRRAKGCIGG